jgi:hypothetical protein
VEQERVGNDGPGRKLEGSLGEWLDDWRELKREIKGRN